jgi:hypothetical protein
MPSIGRRMTAQIPGNGTL